MSNGKDEQTTAPAVGTVQTPKTKQPDTSLNPDTSNVDPLIGGITEFKGLNAYHVKKKLLEDDKEFEKTSKRIFTGLVGVENIEQGDPEETAMAFQEFKKNFRKDLVDSSYGGEDIDETLLNRSIELSNDPSEINVGDYASVIQSNAKKYKKKGLIKDDGTFLYEGDDTAFAQHVLSNSDLHKELQRDRYKAFENELGKYHNQMDGLDEPALKTKAWVIYDKKGPEGLTQFVNKLQDETINDQYDENSYFRKAKVGDTTLSEHYNRFVVGDVEGVKYGREIAEASYKNEIDSALLTGLIRQESNFDPNAESSAGAVGLTQLMPDTARVDLKLDPEERTDPKKSINKGAEYLSGLLQKYKGDEKKALAAYNAGMGNVDKAIKKADKEGGEWMNYLPKKEETLPYIRNVLKYRNEYQDKTDGGLVFRPKKPRQDITEPIPHDLNSYNVQFYNRDGSTKEIENTIDDYIKANVPQAIAKKFDKGKLSSDGPFSDEYRDIVSSVYTRSVEEDGYSTEDLMNVMFANADVKTKDSQGDEYFRIDYNKLTWPQKVAFDALQMNEQTYSMFRDMGDNKYRIIPDIGAKALRANKKVRDSAYMMETKVVKDDQGNISFEQVPDKGGFAQAWNSLVNLTMGGSHFANNYMLKPLMTGLNSLTGGDVDWIRDMQEATEAQSSITLSELSESETDGWLPNATEEIAPMFWYMASMFAGGGAVKAGIGKAMQLGSRAKAGADMTRMGALLNGSSKWNQMGKTIEQSPNVAMKLYAGGAALEALTPKQDSFYNIIPQLVGAGQDNEVSKFYNTSDLWMRKAMDIGGSLMLDFGIDTFIGASKFAKDSFAKKFFDRKEFKSYNYERKIVETDDYGKVVSGQYKMADTPSFTHEVRTFYHQIADDLANKPMGKVGESMGKDLTDNASLKTLHDITKKYTDTTSDVANNMRSEIRENLEALQTKFGNGVRLSDSQMDEFVETQYNRFLETSADNLYKVLKESDDQSLVGRFAQTLEEQLPTVKEFKVGGKKVRPEEAGFWREQKGYNLVVKGDKVFEVDPKFWATDLADRLRQKDLKASAENVANRKARAKGIDVAKPADRADELAQIRKEARETVGQPIYRNDKLGYVADYKDDSVLVRSSDGDEWVKRGELKSGIDPEILRKRLMDELTTTQRLLPAPKGTPTEMLKTGSSRRAFMEQQGAQRSMLETIQGGPQKLLPSGKLRGRYSGEETEFVQQLANVNARISRLANHKQNLDDIFPEGKVDEVDLKFREQSKKNVQREIDQLRQRKADLESDLSRFYQENPKVQKERVQDVIIDKRTRPEFGLQKDIPPAQKELGVEDKRIIDIADQKVGQKVSIFSEHPNTGKRLQDTRVLRKDIGGFYAELRGSKHYLDIKSAGDADPSSASLIFRSGTTEDKGKSFMKGLGNLSAVKATRKKLDEYAKQLSDLAKADTKIPYC